MLNGWYNCPNDWDWKTVPHVRHRMTGCPMLSVLGLGCFQHGAHNFSEGQAQVQPHQGRSAWRPRVHPITIHHHPSPWPPLPLPSISTHCHHDLGRKHAKRSRTGSLNKSEETLATTFSCMRSFANLSGLCTIGTDQESYAINRREYLPLVQTNEKTMGISRCVWWKLETWLRSFVWEPLRDFQTTSICLRYCQLDFRWWYLPHLAKDRKGGAAPRVLHNNVRIGFFFRH